MPPRDLTTSTPHRLWITFDSDRVQRVYSILGALLHPPTRNRPNPMTNSASPVFADARRRFS